jgi:hypothetical protein
MPNPSWDDLSEFFDADDFAVVAVIVQAGVAREVLCHFDAPHVDAQAGGYEANSADVFITAPETALAGIRRGATCNVGGKTYAVLDSPQGSGTGTAVLKLSKEP